MWRPTKKERPLTPEHFNEFVLCYGSDPNVLTTEEKRGEMAKMTERFKKFAVDEIRKRDYNLDIFWLKDDSLEDAADMPEPEELAGEAITHLEAAINGLQEIMVQLSDDNNDIEPQITQD